MIGLIPFIFMCLNYKSNIALWVVINGFLFHSKFIDYTIMRPIDIISNILLTIYVVCVCKYDIKLYIIILSAAICYFILNTNIINTIFIKENKNALYNIKSSFHVVFVQWILCYGMYYVYKNNLIMNNSLTIF